MIKGIIFDFDGILADTEIVSYRIYKKILSSYGHEYTQKDYSEGYSGKTEKVNVNNLIQTYSLPLSYEECFDLVLRTEEELLKEGVELKKGAKELLQYLSDHDIRTAVASSSTRERAVSILKDHGIDNMFDHFVFAEDITHSKPDPEVFTKAQKALGMDQKKCFVLEDSENGIEAGYRAGIPVICIPDMKIPKEEYLNKAEYVLDSLYEVIRVIEEQR